MCQVNCSFRVACWVILFLYRLTLMATLTLVYSWALRPSLQKLPAPPQPHTSQRSVNWQTPQGIGWSVCVLQKLLLFFMSFYFITPSSIKRGISMIGLYLFYLSLLAICFCVCGDIMPSNIRRWKEEFQKQESRKGSSSQEMQTSITIRSLTASLFF